MHHSIRSAASVLLVSLPLLFACSSKPVVQRDVRAAQSEVGAAQALKTQVEVVDAPFIRADRVAYSRSRSTDVDLVADSISLDAALGQIASRANLSLAFAEDVDRSKRVRITLRGAPLEGAVRDVAFAAGYVAIWQDGNKVFVASRGTFTYKVPTHLLDAIQAKYDVANNPDAAGTGSGSGGGGNTGGAGGQGGNGGQGGGAVAISQTRANANVKGAITTGADSVVSYLKAALGADVPVAVLPASGMLSIRGDAQQLRRAQQILDRLVRNATAQVDVRLAVVEVGLTGENQYGIDWTKVVPLSGVLGGGAARVSLSTARIQDPALTTNVTTNSISGVLQALSTRAAVRVIKEPRVRALNNMMGVLRTGTQEPILASLKSDVSGQSGTVTTTATFQYVQDGESLAVVPNILDPETVELTLIPTFSNIAAFREFQVGNVVAKLPSTPLTEGSINLVAKNNHTTIIGGTRIDSATKDLRGVPGLIDIPLLNYALSGTQIVDKSREIVLLVHVSILPGAQGSQLVAESL